MTNIRTLMRRHEFDLRRFRGQLRASDSSDWLESDAPVSQETAPKLPALGPVRSMTNPHANLTIVGQVTSQAAHCHDPELDGFVVTISVAAHHRLLGTRLPIDEGDAAVWVRAALGDEWSPHVFTAGALSTTTDSADTERIQLTTRFYYVFLGSDRKPQSAPQSMTVPLTALA
ncbi:hypothetical protein [Pseudoclavibacter sp. VKM Ac-2867]|uniref:hypothetical protein n=1 Tax=Pseudoclavibacter sp. VKM Ac-2867 TaxID=2783829 RepID=UPI001889FEC7|nr:hypothetical protein [Pseudoclavibacter sp. VKM Ac-2867]MBF4459394.1 hypothetical protein [Pseudoclavibacter sp. VKM Ac-2867]